MERPTCGGCGMDVVYVWYGCGISIVVIIVVVIIISVHPYTHENLM